MENYEIPQFRSYHGEIEFEGVLMSGDIFIDKMLEDRNSFLISFSSKSNAIYKTICANIMKEDSYQPNLKFNGVKLNVRVHSVSQSYIDNNFKAYRIGLVCSNVSHI